MNRKTRLWVIGLVAMSVAATPAVGQGARRKPEGSKAAAAPKAKPKPERRIVKVFRVEHADPSDILSVLQPLGFAVNLATDEASRAIVANGSEEKLAVVERLIGELDTPGRGPSTTMLCLPLKYRNAEDVAGLISDVTGGRHVRVAADALSNLVVIEGRAAQLEAAKVLVERVDRQQSPFSLRFFFIRGTTGGAEPASIDLPQSLRPVGEALAQNGFDNISLLAPLSALCQEGSGFSTSGFLGRTGEEGEGLAFDVEGEAQEVVRGKTVRLRIRAEVRHEIVDVNEQSIFNVETTLSAQLGDYIVLAAAPSSEKDYELLALVVRADAVGER